MSNIKWVKLTGKYNQYQCPSVQRLLLMCGIRSKIIKEGNKYYINVAKGRRKHAVVILYLSGMWYVK